ncbi:response regulator transcription factor [Alicyclobacillus sp. TC]|uniref:DNA-binding response regulator, OmpR family, contains REC and winged-helix (WHTH) domain n=1 Tax=Alicyclobacillus tolerans TaxID=90970 RepID=A0A1M6VZ72_9BACL|nr:MULTISPECIES: response regulator transcription factor [Alicyclobacillus]QRF24180.1 response regulator transcription factor [Alicyclobacillus sp. TC]SHK86790.1 DNA-binding response regulator, OmpR family, contains REC and winged-helix (wHTH) domain [Alicyclobacillus montanus]
MQKILLVEDETGLVEFLRIELELQGYHLYVATTGAAGLRIFEEHSVDLILLDRMLPDINGLEVCRKIREKSDVPVIFLTARGAVEDRVQGLDSGADDYLIKPFAIEELIARIRALTRRKEKFLASEPTGNIQFADVVIDPLRRKVYKDGQLVELTARELDLLLFLWERRGAVISRSELLKQVWGFETPVDTNVVDVYIGYVRQKLDPDKLYIRTVRGLGYMLRSDTP